MTEPLFLKKSDEQSSWGKARVRGILRGGEGGETVAGMYCTREESKEYHLFSHIVVKGVKNKGTGRST